MPAVVPTQAVTPSNSVATRVTPVCSAAACAQHVTGSTVFLTALTVSCESLSGPKWHSLLILQVWLALEEKQIPYDCVLIELYNKPTWYKDIVPSTLVPAVVSSAKADLKQQHSV
jgi:hypothetical protein